MRKNKRLVAFLVLGLTVACNSSAQVSTDGVSSVATFTPDRAHSRIGFKVRHLGIANVRGSFGRYEATARFDPADLSSLVVEATIDVASNDTGVERRDNHLRSDDFFNAEQFPTMTFVSKEVRNVEGGDFQLVGELTIRDVTREVVLQAEFFGTGKMGERTKAGFEARTTVNRFDYNLQWDRVTETGGLVAGSQVEIILELELSEEDAVG